MAISIVQSTSGVTVGSTTTSTAFGSTTTSGNSIVVIVFGIAAIATVTSVTDTSGDKYTAIYGKNIGSPGLVAYMAQNITGGASNVIVANGTANMKGLIAYEVSGLPTSGTLLDQVGSAGSASNPNPMTAALTAPTRNLNDLLVYAGQTDSGTLTLTVGSLGGSTATNFVSVANGTVTFAAEVQVVSSKGIFTGNIGASGSGNTYMSLLIAVSDTSLTQITTLNNYQFLKVGDGMSVSEKIR